MNRLTHPFHRTCIAALWFLVHALCTESKADHMDINPHGEPIPGDPMLAYAQRLECDESIGPVRSDKTHFNWQTDTLSFPNDTFLVKGHDESIDIKQQENGYPPIYMHRCFVLTRAVIQFHKFARFDPSLPKVSEEKYDALIRHICRIPTWWPTFSKEEAIVIPGYKNLRDFSAARQYLFQKDIGWWLITYGRIGNWRMIFPSLPSMRSVAARKITERLDRGDLQAVYMCVFPKMNHCVVIYDYQRQKNGNIVFWAYDPNYHNTSTWLVYDAAENQFVFQKRWFFPGGTVHLMRAYISPFH